MGTRRHRRLARGLWLLVTVAVGISFVGRPLAMRGGVLAAQQAAAEGLAMRHAGMAGDAGMPMPCRHHSGQCCAPCLACCAACVTPPVPAAATPVGLLVAAVRVASTSRCARPGPAPRRPLPPTSPARSTDSTRQLAVIRS